MNVVDCLAIAPYYLTLFVFPDPEIQVSTSTTVEDIYSTALPDMEVSISIQNIEIGDINVVFVGS